MVMGSPSLTDVDLLPAEHTRIRSGSGSDRQPIDEEEEEINYHLPNPGGSFAPATTNTRSSSYNTRSPTTFIPRRPPLQILSIHFIFIHQSSQWGGLERSLSPPRVVLRSTGSMSSFAGAGAGAVHTLVDANVDADREEGEGDDMSMSMGGLSNARA